MDRWKWVNFISSPYFDFAYMYNSCIEPVKPSMIYDSNAKSNAALAYSYLKRIYSY